MTVEIYGIKNCDTMKKALKWLDDNNVDYVFHDYKKEGTDTDVLKQAIAEHGWEQVINRRGTTWRNLPEDIKENMDETQALEIAQDNPSIIKRPLLLHKNTVFLGFSEAVYREIF